jgi:hypothetical protein
LCSDFRSRAYLLGLSSSCERGVGDLKTGGVVGLPASDLGARIVVVLEVSLSNGGNFSKD